MVKENTEETCMPKKKFESMLSLPTALGPTGGLQLIFPHRECYYHVEQLTTPI